MLKLNERFKITGDDEYNYTLYELSVTQPKDKTQAPRMEWKSVGYFGKISHALMSALNKHIKRVITEEDMTCKELLARLAEIEKEAEKIEIQYKQKKTITKAEEEVKHE